MVKSQSSHRDSSDVLKVLSYNIHKGQGALAPKNMLRDLKAAMRHLNPDFVFLQEVIGDHGGRNMRPKDWPTAAQFEYLADDVWKHYAYGKNAVYEAGHHGNAILSKYPVIFSENIDISTNRFERRGLLHCIAEIPETKTPIHLLCLHLDLRENGRTKQVKRLLDHIVKNIPANEALLVAGDFNDWRGTAGKKLVRDMHLKEALLSVHGRHAKTFPSFLPSLELDRIYFRGFEAVDAGCLNDMKWRRLSDHLPVFADLKLSA